MNYLPIADRELRVAVRKQSTFWLRVAAALTGLVIGGGCLLLNKVFGANSVRMGGILFNSLTWLCLVAGLSAGLFFTSDCLSEEKREGTLGLLFLTDLRGYDVALGKLLANSLRSFYALLAVLPILAITLLMGGVTGAQYWKATLALVNALFVSLAAGLAVSVVSRDSQKALTATFFVLLVLALGGPLADGITAGARHRAFQPLCSLSSPAYVLTAASALSRSAYWSALAVTQLIGWALLALACALVPHTWQDRKRAGTGTTRSWAYVWRYGGAGRRQRLRQKLIGREPVAWLTSRERWQSRGLWAMASVAVAGVVAALIQAPGMEVWIIWNYVGVLFTLLLYLWAASQAGRFFVEARRSGLLELLLTAPLNDRQIVHGQWRGLLRMFGLPLALLLSVHVTASTMSQLGFQRLATQASKIASSKITNQSGTLTSRTFSVSTTVTIPAKAGTNAAPGWTSFQVRIPPQQVGMAIASAAAAALSTGANLLALWWFGMWMGLTSKSANLATLKTILFVQVIPWFVAAFATGMVVGLMLSGLAFRLSAAQPAAWFAWWPLLSALLAAVLAVAKDIGFIVWSRNKLRSCLREQAALNPGQPRFAAPLPLSISGPPPPIIPTVQ
jgi:ABC-type transport system involved in multi-copper enzyme maturation permease subunit